MGNLPLVTFAFVSVLGMAVPGPDVVLAITNGSRYGARHAFLGITGVVLSDFVLISIVALGFGALLLASEFYLSALRMFGAFYLLFVAIGTLRNASRPAFNPNLPETHHSAQDPHWALLSGGGHKSGGLAAVSRNPTALCPSR